MSWKMEDEAMELPQMREVVAALQPDRGELREPQRARLRLVVSKRVGVLQPGQVAQHAGPG